MSEVLVALGPFQFYATAPSFEKLKFEAEFRWAQQERIKREPASQFLGPGERSITLDGVIYPEAFGGAELLSGIHAAARAGTVMAFIAMRDQSLQGDVMGLWIVKSIQNTRSYFGRNGPRKIEFAIMIKSYGPDGAGFPGGLF
jgi:uncharacterized protein